MKKRKLGKVEKVGKVRKLQKVGKVEKVWKIWFKHTGQTMSLQRRGASLAVENPPCICQSDLYLNIYISN